MHLNKTKCERNASPENYHIHCIGNKTHKFKTSNEQLMMFINCYQKSDNISLLTFNSQATLCCLFGIQAPPKNAEVLEHVAGNDCFVLLILNLFWSKIKFILVPIGIIFIGIIPDYTSCKSYSRHVWRIKLQVNHRLDSLVLAIRCSLTAKVKMFIVHVFLAKERYLTKKRKSGKTVLNYVYAGNCFVQDQVCKPITWLNIQRNFRFLSWPQLLKRWITLTIR